MVPGTSGYTGVADMDYIHNWMNQRKVQMDVHETRSVNVTESMIYGMALKHAHFHFVSKINYHGTSNKMC